MNDLYNNFTEEQWDAIENAFEALVYEIDESAEPEFALSLENVTFAYDLDPEMEKEVIRMYDDL